MFLTKSFSNAFVLDSFSVKHKKFMKDDQHFNAETFTKSFVLNLFSVVVNVSSHLSIHLQGKSSKLNNVKNAEVDLSLLTISRHTQERCM